MATLDIQTKEQNGVVILGLAGSLDADTAISLDSTMNDLLSDGKTNLVVNLQNTDYISSAGVGCFIGVIKQIRENQGDLRFSNLSAKTLRIFQLLDFQDFFQFFDSESQAVVSFQAQSSNIS